MNRPEINGTRPRFGVAVLVLVAIAFFGGWFWWLTRLDGSIRFLPEFADSGPWIVFPAPAASEAHPEIALPVAFRRRFSVDRVPADARLTMRACTQALILLNGAELPAPDDSRPNWKKPRTFAIADRLRPGQNEIVAYVADQKGPGVFSAVLTGFNLRLATDETWEASVAGSAWRPARLAGAVMAPGWGLTPRKGLDPEPQTRWAFVLSCGLVTAAVLVAWPRWRRILDRVPRPALRQRLADPVWLTLMGAITLRILMFWHNSGLLPMRLGFDVGYHYDYIRFLMTHTSLPFASDGLLMYNPPLYYSLCAHLLGALSLTVDQTAGIAVIRTISLVAIIAQLMLIHDSLGLLFPRRPGPQIAGLLLAAFLPAQLYLSQFITNEVLAGVLATASLSLFLRWQQAQRLSVSSSALLGLCLGAALLTKLTTVLVAAVVLAGVVITVWQRHRWSVRDWMRTFGVMVLVCAGVSAWHYLRAWVHFGNPLVGPWAAESGWHWWQDEGYRTISHFTRFGASLVQPLFSGFHGFADGIYSTLWGDGLCGGGSNANFHPPWDYSLMRWGYWLALAPTLLVLFGAGLTGWRFVRNPTVVGMVLLGLPAAFLVAVLYMDLKVPFYGQVKATYGLVALLPCCVFAAVAWRQLSLIRPWWRFAGALALGTWALVGYATYRVSPDSAQMRILLGRDFALDGKYAAAVGQFRRAVETDPQDYLAASLLANGLKSTGAGREAQLLIEDSVRIHPTEPLCLYDRAFLASETGESAEAVHFARQAVAAAPNYPRGHLFLTQELERTKQYAELEAACREALTVSPANADLHLRLGVALAGELFGPGADPANKSQQAGEASVHLNLATSLAPQSAPTLNRIAWIYATSPIAELRNGALAVQLAESARRLAPTDDPAILSTLAAAYAENGRFGEALTTARNLRALAEASNLAASLSQAREFEELFRRQQPYREDEANLAKARETLMKK